MTFESVITVSVSATSSGAKTVSDNDITANHVVINDSQFCGSDISYTTSAGQIVLTPASGGVPAMVLYLGIPR